MSKILLFTTSYCKDLDTWENRIYKWYKHYTTSSLQFTKLLILDDCSPVLPTWEDCSVLDNFVDEPVDKSFILRFKTHLGRPGHLDYPGWYRSFSFAAKYAYKFNYDKVIHIESDAYLLTSRIIEYFNRKETDWTSLWCKVHNFPETAIQIICKDQILNYFNTTQVSYEHFFKDKTIETCLPFTCIESTFIGDRYHEYRHDIPCDADYACQVE